MLCLEISSSIRTAQDAVALKETRYIDQRRIYPLAYQSAPVFFANGTHTSLSNAASKQGGLVDLDQTDQQCYELQFEPFQRFSIPRKSSACDRSPLPSSRFYSSDTTKMIQQLQARRHYYIVFVWIALWK